MMDSKRELAGWVGRHVLYVAIMAAVYGAVRIDAAGGRTPKPPRDRHGNALPETVDERIARLQEVAQFNEDGVVESLELALLLAIVAASVLTAIRHPEVGATALLFGGWIGLAAIREQDQWFDQWFHGCWMVPASLLGAGLAVHAWRRRRELRPGLMAFVHSPGWGLFVSGVLISMVFARLMGKKDLWSHLIESPRLARNLKNMVEESLEVAGYALLLCGVIEGVAALHRRRRNRSAGVTGGAGEATAIPIEVS